MSLRVAFYLLDNDLVQSEIAVAIDGAQIKTGTIIHFDLQQFLRDQACVRQGAIDGWQGRYTRHSCAFGIRIHANPGRGDVVARLRDGRTIRVESKKGSLARSVSSAEYPLLREAIGQLMTVDEAGASDLLAVAVPKSPKFDELTTRWRRAPLIARLGIQLLTVDRSNGVEGLMSLAE